MLYIVSIRCLRTQETEHCAELKLHQYQLRLQQSKIYLVNGSCERHVLGWTLASSNHLVIDLLCDAWMSIFSPAIQATDMVWHIHLLQVSFSLFGSTASTFKQTGASHWSFLHATTISLLGHARIASETIGLSLVYSGQRAFYQYWDSLGRGCCL